MKDRYVYIAVLTYEENGISIEFPDLPGCYPCAAKDDTAGALKNAKEALGLHIWGMEQDGEQLPNATSITELSFSLPAWLAAKADESGVNCSRLFQNALLEYLGMTGNAKIR